jgi:hypothetical protein
MKLLKKSAYHRLTWSISARALILIPLTHLHKETLDCMTPSLNHCQHTTKMGHPATIDVEGVSDTQAIVIFDPLTVNGVSAHRAKAPKLVAGVAAWTSSDMFKTLVCSDLQILIL